MILLVDNYDSFSYNLYQLCGQLDPDIRVIRNDEMSIEEIERLKPDCILLSPGPGRPEQAGICMELVEKLKGKIPILGVCLGHQAICAAFGSTIGYARKLMHGKQSLSIKQKETPLFAHLPKTFPVGRYHSLAATELSDKLEILAVTEDGEIMAVKAKDYPVYGVQFHPESILTPDGPQILYNFVKEISND